MNLNFVRPCNSMTIEWNNLLISPFILFRFALGGAASRVLKTEFNTNYISKIIECIFASLRSLDWIEVKIFLFLLLFFFFRIKYKKQIQSSRMLQQQKIVNWNGSMKKKLIVQSAMIMKRNLKKMIPIVMKFQTNGKINLLSLNDIVLFSLLE